MTGHEAILLACLKQIVKWIDAGCDPSQKSIMNARRAITLVERAAEKSLPAYPDMPATYTPRQPLHEPIGAAVKTSEATNPELLDTLRAAAHNEQATAKVMSALNSSFPKVYPHDDSDQT